jgi:hypothetical protein
MDLVVMTTSDLNTTSSRTLPGSGTTEHRRSENPLPPAPDPGIRTAAFIAWLKKRGAVWPLAGCTFAWARKGVDVEEEARRLGITKIRICRTGGGQKAVFLPDKVWADRWLRHYGLELPHHSHFQRTVNKCSETENNGNV